MKPKLYVVVPVLNEAPNLPRLFDAFRDLSQSFHHQYQSHFILIDDGSIDNTVQIAESLATDLAFTLLRHEVNRGPGYAFGTAYEFLASRLQDSDWVLTMEGDNTSRHELVKQMFTRTHEGYDVILASVYMYGGGITNTNFWRVVLSNIANVFAKEVLGLHGIMTISSFFRLHKATVIKNLQAYYGNRIIEVSGFEGVVEILMKMVFLRITLSEVPMVLDTNRRIGKSKMKIMKTGLGYLALLRRVRDWKASAEPVVAQPARVGSQPQ